MSLVFHALGRHLAAAALPRQSRCQYMTPLLSARGIDFRPYRPPEQPVRQNQADEGVGRVPACRYRGSGNGEQRIAPD